MDPFEWKSKVVKSHKIVVFSMEDKSLFCGEVIDDLHQH